MKISLLTGGKDHPYVLPLLSGLISQGIHVDFIGDEEMRRADIVKNEYVHFYNVYGKQNPNVIVITKIIRVLKMYIKLLKYSIKTDSKLFHIQWENKFLYFDRTLLNIFYKILGKKLIFTAHNINAGERDGNDTLLNRLTLKFLYTIVDHIIVHTQQMKIQLMNNFNIRSKKVEVIPFGINTIVPKTGLTRQQARNKLQLETNHKTLIFFGNIAPYKGLKYLILALVDLKEKYNDIRLIIAGRIKKNCQAYCENIRRMIEEYHIKGYIIERIEFIPNEDIEVYFKAADVLILPYKNITQSGPLFLSYNFGLPVITTDVGSFRDDVVEGKTGFICKPEDPEDLAKKIEFYFNSDLYKNLEENRKNILEYANDKYSWEKIGAKTHEVYKSLL